LNHLNITLDEAIRYHQLGNFSKAENIYKKIIKKEKSNPDAWHLLGVLSYQMNHLDLSVQNIQKAINLNPNVASFYSNLGLVYHQKKQFKKAIESFKKALKLNANYPEALNNLANSLRKIAKKESSELQEALDCYKKALTLNPNYPEALNNLGNLLVENDNYNEAIKYYEEALKYNANYGDAYYNIGYLYKKTDKLDKALEFFQKALTLPNLTNEYALNSLFDVKREMCDWDGIDELQERLVKETLDYSKTTLMDPFSVVSKLTDYSQNTQYRLIKKYTDRIVNKVDEKIFKHKIKKSEKIRVGYVSANLFNHPTMQNLQGLFTEHNREKFEIYLFGLHYDKDNKYFKAAVNDVDKFVDISKLNDEEAAQKIYDNDVDILIDMQGYITGARSHIFLYKPSPIQVQYHAYPGTMACDFIDYIITDEIITPIKEEKSFSEKFLYMPDTYFITYDKQEISKDIPSKKECNLPEDFFVFCCFNTAYKIEPKIFSLWMNILKEVKDSVLWLYSSNELVIKNLKKEAENLGVESKRLIFGGSLEKEQHLARLKNADIFLDTYYCNAHTTTVDALHAEIPVITCQGDRFASRVASSILFALGLDELIVDDFETYKKLAVNLAKNKDELKRVTTKLRYNKENYPLFNSSLFVKNLENGFEMIHSNYIKNKRPKMMKIQSEMYNENS